MHRIFVIAVSILNMSYALSEGRAPMPLPESRAEIDVYKNYAGRWKVYVESWKSIDVYSVPGVSLEPCRP